MNIKPSKKNYHIFEDDKDFDGDVEDLDEDEYYKGENNINKIVNKIESNSSFNQGSSKNNRNNKASSKSNNSKKISNNSSINKNIKEKEYIESNISNSLIESNISNSLISEISNPKIQKKYAENKNHISLHINIKTENKNNLDDNCNENENKMTSLNQNSNINLQQTSSNFFDICSNNSSNLFQLDNSEFLLNKLKGNKLLQEIKLKKARKNKFSYYGKTNELEDIDNNKENEKNIDINNNNAIVFNIIDNKNNLKEKLNQGIEKEKRIEKNDKKKVKKKNYLKKRVNKFYFKYVFNCNCKCLCRNRRISAINLFRNIFICLIILSAIGFYSIIFFS